MLILDIDSFRQRNSSHYGSKLYSSEEKRNSTKTNSIQLFQIASAFSHSSALFFHKKKDHSIRSPVLKTDDTYFQTNYQPGF
jgi:hypothetical protein